MIWQNLGNVLLFELLYRGICLPVYLRLANRVLRWTLGIAGYSYLTASNFAGFLGCPWTLPALLVVGILKAADESVVAASTEYSTYIHAAVEKDNLYACQFHPEKSGDVGLRILKNFVEL